jgi:hypothetical protein
MLSSEQHDHVIKLMLTSTIVFLVLHKVLGMSKTFSMLGIVASAVGTIVLVWDEVRRTSNRLKYLSTGEGLTRDKEFAKRLFCSQLREYSWYSQVIIRIAVWFSSGRLEKWAYDASKDPVFTEFPIKIWGLIFLFFGFFLQLIGTLL